jgi:hypothetical protein
LEDKEVTYFLEKLSRKFHAIGLALRSGPGFMLSDSLTNITSEEAQRQADADLIQRMQTDPMLIINSFLLSDETLSQIDSGQTTAFNPLPDNPNGVTVVIPPSISNTNVPMSPSTQYFSNYYDPPISSEINDANTPFDAPWAGQNVVIHRNNTSEEANNLSVHPMPLLPPPSSFDEYFVPDPFNPFLDPQQSSSSFSPTDEQTGTSSSSSSSSIPPPTELHWQTEPDFPNTPIEFKDPVVDISGREPDLFLSPVTQKGPKKRKPTKEKGNRVKCPKCDQDFSNRSNMLRHLRSAIHSGRSVCSQPGCNESFPRQHDLNKHMKDYHGHEKN